MVDSVDDYLFDEPLVLIGEDGAPFFDSDKPVAFFVSGKIWVNNHIHVLRVRENFDPRFVTHCLNVTDYGPLVDGSTRDKLTQEKLGSIPLPSPPLAVQTAIAAYLDRETTRLGRLLFEKQRMLDLLAERRRALTTRAVTRGLYASGPLRASGVPWLREVPRDWQTQRAAHLFRERDERGEPDLPLLEVSIKDGVVAREFSRERIETTAADFNTYKIARRGDVVFNKMRMWQGAAGVAPRDGLVSPDYIVAASTGALSPAYVGLLFRIGSFSAECARQSRGIVWDRMRLYWEGFREIELPVPPPETQLQIVDYVVDATAKLDALARAAARTVSLLKERRGTLIAAAVNGKVELDSAA